MHHHMHHLKSPLDVNELTISSVDCSMYFLLKAGTKSLMTPVLMAKETIHRGRIFIKAPDQVYHLSE